MRLGAGAVLVPGDKNRNNKEVGIAKKKKQRINVNRDIKAKEVRAIDDEGNQLGILPLHRALAAADERGLDLVEVSPAADPPVCKIMDYGRYKYEQTKKNQEAKKKQATVHLKEVKVRPKTDTHDLETKIRMIRRFLEKKDKVKVSVFFRGREIALSNKGTELLQMIAAETEDVAQVEFSPKFEGRYLFMILAPRT
ncbi:MAG: translation initiation factor IF-3 [Desulfosudaceae bacterium]